MPSDLVLKTMNTLHRGMLRLTGGRVGWDAASMPVVELTTIGRRSGRRHTVMLTSPLQEGDTWVLVASRGGDDRHPAWFLNLRDTPEVEAVVRGGERRPMRARVAGAEERAELWPRVTAAQPRYAGYQRRTRREIPLVVLEPVAG